MNIENFDVFWEEYSRDVKPECMDSEESVRESIQNEVDALLPGEFIPYWHEHAPEECKDGIGRRFWFEMKMDEDTKEISINYAFIVLLA